MRRWLSSFDGCIIELVDSMESLLEILMVG